jgi:glycosyltransferase involved in cell wall biosynthesis
MRESIERERPDVVNVHNLYPFISPAALRECKKAGIPVVMTIHNFRLMCPTGLFMRYGKPCELCLQKGNEWGCVRYNCEQSILKSVGYAARNAVARIKRHYLDCVDVFACITDFQRQKLIAAGFPKEKLTVIPNSIDLVGDRDSNTEGSYIAYSGRISWEKGVDLIMEVARRHPKLQFRLAGAVREKELVENLPENVSLMGYLSGEELNRFYNGAKFFVMASRWYEGFPMTILETAQFGKPMVAPDHGGFTEIIGKGGDAIGRLFIPGDIDSLEKEVVGLWNNTDEVTRLGNAAYNKLNREYSTQVIAQKWAGLIQSLTLLRSH